MKQLPKAELHVHLEGTVDRAGLAGLPSVRGSGTPIQADRLFEHRDFADFLAHFRSILDLLKRPEDYGYLAGRYLDTVRAQGASLVEFYVSLGAAARRGVPTRALLESIQAAADARPGMTVGVIADTVRQFGPDEAMRALERCLENMDLGIVAGFGMGGDELSVPAAAFSMVFRRARDAGLRTACHAGEVGDASSVRAALTHLRPERIAHGIAAGRDPELMAQLVRDRVTLDVCITSNLRTGAVGSLEEHPIGALHRAGVRMTLGTDDPGLFGTDLVREYLLAARAAELEAADLSRIATTSLEAAFVGTGP